VDRNVVECVVRVLLGGGGHLGVTRPVPGNIRSAFPARKTLRKRSPSLSLNRFLTLFFFCCLGSGFSLLSVHLEHLLAMLKYGLRRLEYVFYIYVYLYSFPYRINVTGTIVQNSRVVEFCIMLECSKLRLRMLPNFVDPTKILDLLNVN